jgi:hypothetical protein
MLAEIAGYLVANSIGTLGTNIFIADIPEKPDLAVMLFDRPGSQNLYTYDGERVEMPGLQVLVRGEQSDYSTARTKAATVYALLDGVANTVIGTHTYLSIMASSPPYDYGPDGMGRQIFETNFQIRRT